MLNQQGRDAVAQLAELHFSQAKTILPPKPPKLEIISAAELSEKHFEPIPHVVDNLLPAGLTVFAAPPKTGKSWFCLALSEAVVHGKPFFGRNTLQGDVLYFDLESKQARVKARMKPMGFIPSQNLGLAFEANDLQHGLLDQLTEWHDAHQAARLVILDTFARIKGVSPRNVDAYSADSRLLAPLQRWALDRNIALVLVTHLRKQTRYVADADPFELITGSNGQFGIADTAWLITGQRTDEQRHLVISGRDLESQDLIISFDKKRCRWQCIGDAESVERASAVQSPIMKTVLALLAESDAVMITANDLLEQSMQLFGSAEGLIPSELGKRLKALSPMLAALGVCYTPPASGGRKGRMHRFTRNG